MTAFPGVRLGDIVATLEEETPRTSGAAVSAVRLGDVALPSAFSGLASRRGSPLRSRPRCRAKILREHLFPGARVDTPDGLRARALRPDEVWDELTVGVADPTLALAPLVRVSPGLRKELKLMLLEAEEV